MCYIIMGNKTGEHNRTYMYTPLKWQLTRTMLDRSKLCCTLIHHNSTYNPIPCVIYLSKLNFRLPQGKHLQMLNLPNSEGFSISMLPIAAQPHTFQIRKQCMTKKSDRTVQGISASHVDCQSYNELYSSTTPKLLSMILNQKGTSYSTFCCISHQVTIGLRVT